MKGKSFQALISVCKEAVRSEMSKDTQPQRQGLIEEEKWLELSIWLVLNLQRAHMAIKGLRALPQCMKSAEGWTCFSRHGCLALWAAATWRPLALHTTWSYTVRLFSYSQRTLCSLSIINWFLKLFQVYRIHLQCGRLGFDPWVGKIPWRREGQPTLVFLPGEFHGQRSLAGYSPWGCKESDTTKQLTLRCY